MTYWHLFVVAQHGSGWGRKSCWVTLQATFPLLSGFPEGRVAQVRRLRFCLCLWHSFPTWPWQVLLVPPFPHFLIAKTTQLMEQSKVHSKEYLIKGKRRVKYYNCCHRIQKQLHNNASIASFLSLQHQLSEGHCLTRYLHPSGCTQAFTSLIQNQIVVIWKTLARLFWPAFLQNMFFLYNLITHNNGPNCTIGMMAGFMC